MTIEKQRRINAVRRREQAWASMADTNLQLLRAFAAFRTAPQALIETADAAIAAYEEALAQEQLLLAGKSEPARPSLATSGADGLRNMGAP